MSSLKHSNNKLKKFASIFTGEFRFDKISRLLYATDASAYREVPIAVAIPQNTDDIKKLINFARDNNLSLIPRGAGTSLAGQVVGSGIVVDISKFLNQIIEINPHKKWVSVQPGVVLSDLNRQLKKQNLMFGPETSTANRCTMGGMLGNNSCGLHSLVYGSVREHILEVTALLSDGSEAIFKSLTETEFQQKCLLPNLEGDIYRFVNHVLQNDQNRVEIEEQYPHKSVPRRNNGYALDILAQMKPFSFDGELFNMAKLIAGSEGTLAFVTQMKLHAEALPPPLKALMCVHFSQLEHAFYANLIALKHKPSAVELMDKKILDLTKENITQNKNRFFIQDDPQAILIIELWGNTHEEIELKAQNIEQSMRAQNYGYHFPLVWGENIARVWALRTAGLGVLSNMPGDAKPVSVVEDTAIPVDLLPDFLSEFKMLLNQYQLESVYHAHIATGELHLRPILNLKNEKDVEIFRLLAKQTAQLVKKFKGSLSGEHGDGRLRGEFIPLMLGDKIYSILKQLKNVWDPKHIFNPGKITDTPPMNQSLRYESASELPNLNSYFSYKTSLGMARAIEKCNGSADCRKSQAEGGTMCPSFMVTHDELHSTRGRANILREMLTRKQTMHWADSRQVFEALDLCLSCKACKSECPSGVDITKLKADFLQNHYDANPVPLSVKIIAHYPGLMHLAGVFYPFSKIIFRNKLFAALIKKVAGFSQKRPLPLPAKISLKKWNKKHIKELKPIKPSKKVYLFNDEFLNTSDSAVGIKAVLLLEKLGYEVIIPKHTYSGRTYMSKGLLKKAQKIAEFNVKYLKDIITSETPLIGIEPSALLSFRDEYPELLHGDLSLQAKKLAENCFLFDEFFMREVNNNIITADKFTRNKVHIKLHAHCHQKAIATSKTSIEMLKFPENYTAEEIPSGCCGMAGAFGYEKNHYELSMKIGEMVLFPAVRSSAPEVIIAAPGTSCREQIEHGTGRKAYHPVEILYDALVLNEPEKES